MNKACRQLLAGPGFALDKDGFIDAIDIGDHFLYFNDFRAVADNQRAVSPNFFAAAFVQQHPVNGRFDFNRIRINFEDQNISEAVAVNKLHNVLIIGDDHNRHTAIGQLHRIDKPSGPIQRKRSGNHQIRIKRLQVIQAAGFFFKNKRGIAPLSNHGPEGIPPLLIGFEDDDFVLCLAHAYLTQRSLRIRFII